MGRGKGVRGGEDRERGPQFEINDPTPVIRWLVTGLLLGLNFSE